MNDPKWDQLAPLGMDRYPPSSTRAKHVAVHGCTQTRREIPMVLGDLGDHSSADPLHRLSIRCS